VRLTLATTLVLQAIERGHRYGFDIVDVTQFPTGTIYPALRRLERAGLVRSEWESDRTAAAEGRPARRYYEITPRGVEALEASLSRLRTLRIIGVKPKAASL
jgi:PadR family transcriptional regulator PadR